jgi:hypothetical protein
MKDREAKFERARQDAEDARAQLQAAIDALKDGFVLWDRDDRLVVCNEAFRRQFGLIENVGPGRTSREILLDLARTGAIPDAVGREEEWADAQAAARATEIASFMRDPHGMFERLAFDPGRFHALQHVLDVAVGQDELVVAVVDDDAGRKQFEHVHQMLACFLGFGLALLGLRDVRADAHAVARGGDLVAPHDPAAVIGAEDDLLADFRRPRRNLSVGPFLLTADRVRDRAGACQIEQYLAGSAAGT